MLQNMALQLMQVACVQIYMPETGERIPTLVSQHGGGRKVGVGGMEQERGELGWKSRRGAGWIKARKGAVSAAALLNSHPPFWPQSTFPGPLVLLSAI